jgi:hypothetical protein
MWECELQMETLEVALARGVRDEGGGRGADGRKEKKEGWPCSAVSGQRSARSAIIPDNMPYDTCPTLS